MIREADLTLAGRINKTHGTGGEMSISFFSPAVMDSIEPDACLILDIDGIYTPFFADSVRPRSSEALLVKLSGIDTQEDAAPYVGKDVYMATADMAQDEDDDDAYGMYAGQLIGYTAITDDGTPIGTIDDIDESTDNVLFVITDPEGRQVYVPVVDEFITDISTEDRTITFDLPEGLLSL